MSILNLGILAHVDAGKTSLTERLLFEGGAIARLGSVDEGSTQTDSLELERQRGITIKSAVASLNIRGVSVNLIDTPGHPDFIAEVERVLAVLDGAVLVLSSVEGVQAQTRVLYRALERLKVPTLLFANKIDRRGARVGGLLDEIRERLTPDILCMSTVVGEGTLDAVSSPRALDDPEMRLELIEKLADHDEEALQAFVSGTWTVDDAELARRMSRAVGAQGLRPVYFGSAVQGAGINGLMQAIAQVLPRPEGRESLPLDAGVFKIERSPKGERLAYVRVYQGTLPLRHKHVYARNAEERVTSIQRFRDGGLETARELQAGEIGKVGGLTTIRIGDRIGIDRSGQSRAFSPPTLETLIVPRQITSRGALLAALMEMADQDPLINVRQDDVRQEVYISLYGEVQKEVIGETLKRQYGIEVSFQKTTTICIERLTGTGADVEYVKQGVSPFLATIGLRVEPRPLGSGNDFRLEVELGSIPLAFHRAVEETVEACLQQGLYGWEVTDCRVTMTHSGYLARQSHSYSAFDKTMSSTAGDFRNLTPLVFMEALKAAGTVVCEPINRFSLEIPADLVGAVFPLLTRHNAAPGGPLVRGLTALIEGTIPASEIHGLQQMLPHLTRGEGIFEATFDHYEPVDGPPPMRPRTDKDPLNRTVYLMRLGKKV